MGTTRLLLLGGIVFVALMALNVAVVGGSTPASEAAASEIAAFYEDEIVRQVMSGALLAASAPFLLFFAVGLAGALAPSRTGPGSAWELVMVAGGTLAAGMILLTALLHFALVEAVDEGLSPGALEAVNVIEGSTWVAFAAGLGLMLLGAARRLASHRGGRRVLGWAALVLGVAAFLPFASFFALVLTALWIVVASIVLARGEVVRGAAVPRTA